MLPHHHMPPVWIYVLATTPTAARLLIAQARRLARPYGTLVAELVDTERFGTEWHRSIDVLFHEHPGPDRTLVLPNPFDSGLGHEQEYLHAMARWHATGGGRIVTPRAEFEIDGPAMMTFDEEVFLAMHRKAVERNEQARVAEAFGRLRGRDR